MVNTEDSPEQESIRKKETTRRFIWGISVMDSFLRVTALIGSFSSAVVMAASDQTLPGFTRFFRFKAQYSDLPTFTLFIFTNSIVCAYLVLSLPLSIFHINAIAARSSRVILVMFDTVMLAFLTGAASAATAVVYIVHNGAPQANWYPVCQRYNKFCNHISGALVGSLVGVVAFLLLTLLSAIGISTRR